MKINLIDIPAISKETQQQLVKIINLYPYLVHAVDIYITCSKSETYNWLFTKSSVFDHISGETNLVPKLSISLDGVIYPLEIGSPGESSTNPITFIRPIFKVNLVKPEGTVGYIGTPPDGYVEGQEELDDDLDPSKVVGTNIVSDDYVPMTLIVNDPQIIESDVYPFGGASASGMTYDGFGGVDSENPLTMKSVEGYGGVKPNEYLKDVIIVVQKSQFNDDLNNKEIGIGAQSYGIRY